MFDTVSFDPPAIPMMDKAKLEYVWLDGYEPTQNMRSKTLVKSNFEGTLEECPMWCFDGSSTRQGLKAAIQIACQTSRYFPRPATFQWFSVCVKF